MVCKYLFARARSLARIQTLNAGNPAKLAGLLARCRPFGYGAGDLLRSVNPPMITAAPITMRINGQKSYVNDSTKKTPTNIRTAPPIKNPANGRLLCE